MRLLGGGTAMYVVPLGVAGALCMSCLDNIISLLSGKHRSIVAASFVEVLIGEVPVHKVPPGICEK